MQTTCGNCDHELDGYVIKGSVMFAEDIVAFFSQRITRETVNEWFVAGELTGWKKRGVRGWFTTVEQFEHDLKKRGRKQEQPRPDGNRKTPGEAR